MRRDELKDLAALLAIAEAQSFTLAAARLGMSPSALSHSMRGLEERLGVRLLARSTRSVRPTEAGDRLLRVLRPALADIEAELAVLREARGRPAGSVRLTTFKYAATSILEPALPGFLEAYPDVRVEVTIDDNLVDVVRSGHDAGIRMGHTVDRDMISIPVGPDIPALVVGSPGYLARHGTPMAPSDLAGHSCILHRRLTPGDLHPWPFQAQGRPFLVKVDGRLTFSDSDMILSAALAGQGLAYLFEGQVAQHMADGRLAPVLSRWCTTHPGCHLYYPSRRQTPPAFTALVDALRFRPPTSEAT